MMLKQILKLSRTNDAMMLKQILKLSRTKDTMMLKQIMALTVSGAPYWLEGRLWWAKAPSGIKTYLENGTLYIHIITVVWWICGFFNKQLKYVYHIITMRLWPFLFQGCSLGSRLLELDLYLTQYSGKAWGKHCASLKNQELLWSKQYLCDEKSPTLIYNMSQHLYKYKDIRFQ